MDSTFDSFSLDSSDRCTGPNSFLPSPISIPPCNPHISVIRRPTPRRSVTTSFENKPSASRRAQAPINNDNYIAPESPQSAYPSPPNTDLQLSCSHSLPSTRDTARSSSLFAADGKFGILDSPLVMRREDLRASPEKPLSPPLTLPLSTLTLPETDSEFSSAHHEGCVDGSEQQSTQEGVNGESQVGLRKDTLSDVNEETFSDLLQAEGMDLSNLSPLAPSWESEMSMIPENSALLGSSSLAARRSRGSLVADRERDRDRGQQPYDKRNRSGPYLNVAAGYNASPSPPWSPQSPEDVTLPTDLDEVKSVASSSSRQEEVDMLYMPTPLSTARQNGVSSSHGQSPGSDSLSSFHGSEPSDFWSPGSSTSGPSSRDFDFNRPFLLPIDIPKPSSHTQPHIHAPQGSDLFIPKLFDDDYSMDVDHEQSPSSSSALSPSIFSPSPYEFDPASPASSVLYEEPRYPPSSPSIPQFSLPDLDLDFSDHELHPSSPSRRSFASLPDLEMDDPPDIVDIDANVHLSFPSPSQSLLSLPGADTDEDLLPPPAPNFKTPSPPPHASSPSLLFIDDPRDVPLPRSPSPEDFEFDLNVVLDDESDPELTKLYNLHKKSLAAERAARHAEAQLIDAGSISLRAEATKEKKKNKQRSKEVGALLRIKLGDQVACAPATPTASVDGRPKGMINCMSQLVARMMFRRHETFRPLANRKTATTNHNYVRSSLSRTTVADFGGVDFR